MRFMAYRRVEEYADRIKREAQGIPPEPLMIYPSRKYYGSDRDICDVTITEGRRFFAIEEFNFDLPYSGLKIDYSDPNVHNRKNYPYYCGDLKYFYDRFNSERDKLAEIIWDWSDACGESFFSTRQGFRFKTEGGLLMFRLKFL